MLNKSTISTLPDRAIAAIAKLFTKRPDRPSAVAGGSATKTKNKASVFASSINILANVGDRLATRHQDLKKIYIGDIWSFNTDRSKPSASTPIIITPSISDNPDDYTQCISRQMDILMDVLYNELGRAWGKLRSLDEASPGLDNLDQIQSNLAKQIEESINSLSQKCKWVCLQNEKLILDICEPTYYNVPRSGTTNFEHFSKSEKFFSGFKPVFELDISNLFQLLSEYKNLCEKATIQQENIKQQESTPLIKKPHKEQELHSFTGSGDHSPSTSLNSASVAPPPSYESLNSITR